jgi:hypothetical protein
MIRILNSWREERALLRALRGIARQRVAIVLQPGNAWVVDNAVPDDENTEAALRTCHMRGWVEALVHAVTTAPLGADLDLSKAFAEAKQKPIYRLTEAGWNALHRTQGWIMATCFIAGVTLIATVIGTLLTIKY